MILVLELARGLAALWVFFFHVRGAFEASSPLVFEISSHGWLGVPMFFVISGYVITCSAESSRIHDHPPIRFLKARLRRIYPAFWASVLVVLAVPYVMEAVSALKSGSYAMPRNLLAVYDGTEWLHFLLLTKVFWAQSTDLQQQFSAINAVYWTLAIEVQFYIVVFLALCCGPGYRYVILAVSAASMVWLVAAPDAMPGLFIHHWAAFAVGAGLAYLHRLGVRPQSFFQPWTAQALAGAVGFVGALVLGAAFDGSLLFASLFAGVLFLASGMEGLLVRVQKGPRRAVYWLLKPWLVLGAMSYSVYLLHLELCKLTTMFVRQMVGPDSILFGLGTVAGTLCLCYPFYVLVERRFMSRNYRKLHEGVLAQPAVAPDRR